MHSYHWNVTGPQFNDLHAMFMVQYTELWTSVDLIAERIRSLGHFAPGTSSAVECAFIGRETVSKRSRKTRRSNSALGVVRPLVAVGHDGNVRCG